MERLIEVFRDGGVVNINSFLHLIASDPRGRPWVLPIGMIEKNKMRKEPNKKQKKNKNRTDNKISMQNN